MNVAVQIPTLATINHMTLMKAVRTEAYKRCLHSVEQEVNARRGSLAPINFAHTISLLYCLIVVPKEVWRPEKGGEIYSEIQRRRLCDHFTIDSARLGFHANPSYFLIHHLRNAVAHVHFSLSENRRFNFWDQRTETSQPHFRASTSLDGLGLFLADVAKLFDKLRVSVEDGGSSPLPRPEQRH